MTTEIIMRKVKGKLEPMTEMAADDLVHVPADVDLFVTVRTRRNPNQHKLFWALCQKLSDNCDFLHDTEDAATYLKFKCRHVHVIVNNKTGESIVVPKSISYASMPQAQFDRFFKRAVYVICTEIIPGLSQEALQAEILEMVK